MAINNRIFSPVTGGLKILSFGQTAGGTAPIRVDEAGQAVIASAEAQAVTATGLDIRGLTGAGDSMELYSRSGNEDSESGSIVALGNRIFLTKNIGAYSAVSYLVINTSGVAVTVELQIAPIDSDNYYVTDGSSFSLLAYDKMLLSPSQPTQYARIRVSALLLASTTVYFYAQA